MIALEPEAASLYCQYMPVNRFASGGADSQASLASPGTVYMVVDLGGKNKQNKTNQGIVCRNIYQYAKR